MSLPFFFPALAVSAGAILLALLAGAVCGLAGGALSGIKIAGADLGNEMAGMMGGLYGVSTALPAIIIGLIILLFI